MKERRSTTRIIMVPGFPQNVNLHIVIEPPTRRFLGRAKDVEKARLATWSQRDRQRGYRITS